MFSRDKRRLDNQINAGSMADIAFLLLIFFLVTTTILVDEGILVKLPPWDPNNETGLVRGRNVFVVKINGQDELLVEGEQALVADLRAGVKEFILNPLDREDLAINPQKAVISLQNDRSTSYDLYLSVYNEIKAAYRELWDEEARRQYKRDYDILAEGQRKKVRDAIPMIISEAEPTDYQTE